MLADSREGYEHLCELRSVSSGNLLGAQLAELSLQLPKLLLEVVLVFGPKLASLDFSGRLRDVEN